MTEKTALEASNDFFFEFKQEKQRIENNIETASTLPKTELPIYFNQLLQQINQLEKKVTKATDFIPSYDARQFSLQLKELVDRLNTTQSQLQPKPKFSFKSRKKTPKPTPVPVTPTVEAEADYLNEATVLFKQTKGCHLSIKDKVSDTHQSVDVLLSDLEDCVILLQDDHIKISAIHIKNVTRCVILCGAIDGSILMYGLSHSILVVGCHQLRMHDAHHVDMLLHVTSKPIIEDSNKIQVGKYNISDAPNYYDQMEDFNWLKKQESPNWRVMDEAREDEMNGYIRNEDRIMDIIPLDVIN
ncbi:tubulin binding cofactor C-domain-containing protein [Pilobolus umbonatus]|nr:tubulin binding cofactor C-domain-containing protein [Pilobolus umbonatus]